MRSNTIWSADELNARRDEVARLVAELGLPAELGWDWVADGPWSIQDRLEDMEFHLRWAALMRKTFGPEPDGAAAQGPDERPSP